MILAIFLDLISSSYQGTGIREQGTVNKNCKQTTEKGELKTKTGNLQLGTEKRNWELNKGLGNRDQASMINEQWSMIRHRGYDPSCYCSWFTGHASLSLQM